METIDHLFIKVEQLEREQISFKHLDSLLPKLDKKTPGISTKLQLIDVNHLCDLFVIFKSICTLIKSMDNFC